MAFEQHAPDRFGPPDRTLDPTTGVALNVQLAAILRHQVLSGQWPPGHRLDNLDVLAAQFGVARITVRQAVARLVHEGLLTTQRRRGTSVRDNENDRDGDRPRGRRIPVTGSWPDDLRIAIVFKGRSRVLPDEFRTDFDAFERYVEISKIHLVHDRPFAMVRVFAAAEVYQHFPRRAIERTKVLRLVFAHGGEAAEHMRQRMTVEPADPLIAKHLAHEVGSPVAKILRQIHGADRRLAYAGISWYRGDSFEMDMTLPRALVADSSPALIAPGVKTP